MCSHQKNLVSFYVSSVPRLESKPGCNALNMMLVWLATCIIHINLDCV